MKTVFDFANVFPYNLADDLLRVKGIPFYQISPPDLEKAIYLLTPRQRDLILKRYRDGIKSSDLEKEYGVTRERIRQLIEKAMENLLKESVLATYLLVPYGEERFMENN